MGCSDFRFRVGGSLEPPGWTPPPQKSSRDRFPQNDPATSLVSMEGGRRGGGCPRGRMGVGQGIGRGGGTLFR